MRIVLQNFFAIGLLTLVIKLPQCRFLSFCNFYKKCIGTDNILIGKYIQAKYLCRTNYWATHNLVDQKGIFKIGLWKYIFQRKFLLYKIDF